MKMKNILIVLTAVLLCVAGIRIWYVNTNPDPQFIPPQDEVHQMGEWVALDGAFQFESEENTKGFFVKLEDVEFMTPQEYTQRYNIDLSLFKIGPNGEMPEYVADVTLNFKNDKNTDGYIQFIYYQIFSTSDLTGFTPLSSVNIKLHPTLSDKSAFMLYPDSETGPKHFCLISEVDTVGTTMGNLKHFPKYLQVSITPVRKVIEIKEK